MRVLTLVFIPALLLGGCVVATPAPEVEQTPDGLARVQSRQVDTLYVKKGATLAPYKRVMLDSVDFAFKQDWQKQHPEVSAADLTRVRSQGAAVFYEIFSGALTMNGGFPLTMQAGPDVLRVTATISELDLSTAPAVGGTQRMHVVSPQDLTLLMELRDSQSGALLARAIDRDKGRASGDLRVEGDLANSTEARQALQMWAGLLRSALDAARAAPAQGAQ
jgi:hypothetical protein